jgi:hypothetical protein
MLRRVSLVSTDFWEERSASFITVTRIGEVGTTPAVTNNRCTRHLLVTTSVVPTSPILVTLMKGALRSFKTSVRTRDTRRNIPEDDILHSHCREHIKSYMALSGLILWRRSNVSPVRYELGFYIPEDGILHSHRSENLKSYTDFM